MASKETFLSAKKPPEEQMEILHKGEFLQVKIHHCSLFTDNLTTTCKGSVIINIPSDQIKGSVSGICDTCHQTVVVSVPKILIEVFDPRLFGHR